MQVLVTFDPVRRPRADQGETETREIRMLSMNMCLPEEPWPLALRDHVRAELADPSAAVAYIADDHGVVVVDGWRVVARFRGSAVHESVIV